MFRIDCQLEGLGEFMEGIGFFDKLADAETHGPVDVFGFGVPGGDDGLLAWNMLEDALICFAAIDARIHHHVQNNQIHRCRFEVFDRFFARMCSQWVSNRAG